MLTSTRSRRMPALLTRTWRSPKASTAVSIRRLPPSQSADVVGVGHRLAPGRGDLVHHLLGRGAVVARAVDRAAEVVDHHLGPLGGEQQGVLASDAAAGPGDDRDPSVQCSHVVGPPVVPIVSGGWRPRERAPAGARHVGRGPAAGSNRTRRLGGAGRHRDRPVHLPAQAGSGDRPHHPPHPAPVPGHQDVLGVAEMGDRPHLAPRPGCGCRSGPPRSGPSRTPAPRRAPGRRTARAARRRSATTRCCRRGPPPRPAPRR